MWSTWTSCWGSICQRHKLSASDPARLFALVTDGSSSAAITSNTPAQASGACFVLGKPESAGHSPPVCCHFTETQQRSRVSPELAEKTGSFLPSSAAPAALLPVLSTKTAGYKSTSKLLGVCYEGCRGLSRVCRAQGQVVTTEAWQVGSEGYDECLPSLTEAEYVEKEAGNDSSPGNNFRSSNFRASYGQYSHCSFLGCTQAPLALCWSTLRGKSVTDIIRGVSSPVLPTGHSKK